MEAALGFAALVSAAGWFAAAWKSDERKREGPAPLKGLQALAGWAFIVFLVAWIVVGYATGNNGVECPGGIDTDIYGVEHCRT